MNPLAFPVRVLTPDAGLDDARRKPLGAERNAEALRARHAAVHRRGGLVENFDPSRVQVGGHCKIVRTRRGVAYTISTISNRFTPRGVFTRIVSPTRAFISDSPIGLLDVTSS